MSLLSSDHAFVVLIDVQERFIPHIQNADRLIQRCRAMLTIAQRLALPVIVSEQYPQGLGATDARLMDVLPDHTICHPKMHFSCMKNSLLRELILAEKQKGRHQAIIIGIEAHVCVLQTALDMLEAGLEVFAVTDGIEARSPVSCDMAFARMRQQGAQMVTMEMALTELVQDAGKPEFKALMGLMKEA